MKYYSLNIKSDFYFYNSLVDEKNLISSLQNKGYSGAGINDLNSLSHIASYSFNFKDEGLKFVIETSVQIKIRDFNLNITLVVKDDDGFNQLLAFYRSKLCKLQDSAVTSSSSSHYFLDVTDLKDLDKLTAIVSTNNILFRNKENVSMIVPILKELDKLFNSIYVGVEVYNNTEKVHFEEVIYSLLDDEKIECIPFPNVEYISKSDKKARTVLTAIKDNLTLSEVREEENNYFLIDSSNLDKIYREKDLNNLESLVESISFDYSQTKRGHLLSFTGSKETDDKLFVETLNSELEKRNLGDEYRERMESEIGVITKMNYSSYFLIVSDYINFAKNSGIEVGPGRGSSAGCLCSYLLNITAVDPIKYNLSFSRFLNEERHDLPDIDVDIEDTRRGDVINYLKEKYGSSNVTNIVTYNTFQFNSALKAVAKALDFDINDRIFASLINDLIKRYNHFTSFKEIEKDPLYKNKYVKDSKLNELLTLTFKLIGVRNNNSVHAAGIILSATPLYLDVPLSLGDSGTCQIEFKYLEKLGFLKMDILGLSNLHFIHQIEDNIRKYYKGEPLFDNLKTDLDDPIVYNTVNHLLFDNIFQLSSRGIRSKVKEVKINSFKELVALLALYRPGPMDNISLYKKNKDNPTSIRYIHPKLKPILDETYGIIVYQEQILRILTEIGNLSQSESDLFRRAMSKKDESKMNLYKDKFINGCQKFSSLSPKESYDLFNMIFKFSSYGFNKSHSVSYSLISYKLLYYKTYFTSCFYLASLENCQVGDEAYISILKEMEYFGIKIKNPDINISNDKKYIFDIKSNTIYLPLKAISKINSQIIEEIASSPCRPYKSLGSFLYNYPKNDKNFTFNMTLLIDSGSLDSLNSDRSLLRENLELIEQSSQCMISETDEIILERSGYEDGNNSSNTVLNSSKSDREFLINFVKEKESIKIAPSKDLNSIIEGNYKPVNKNIFIVRQTTLNNFSFENQFTSYNLKVQNQQVLKKNQIVEIGKIQFNNKYLDRNLVSSTLNFDKYIDRLSRYELETNRVYINVLKEIKDE